MQLVRRDVGKLCIEGVDVHNAVDGKKFGLFRKNSRQSLLISPIESNCHILAIINSSFNLLM